MLKLRNEITGKLEVFKAIIPGQVSIYVCGITPYDTTHLGHAFTYLSYDALIRYLEYQGYVVHYVQNVTDIDDDVLRKGRELGVDWYQLGNRWTTHFIEDLRNLNVRPPDFFPRATETIPDMFPKIEEMIKQGTAYVVNGSVYYHVAAYQDFGQVSGLSAPEWLPTANERGNHPDDPNKRDPLDFVLWQAQAPGEPAWPSPWGLGRPGWHIECSTMACKYLGDTIDIHGGGADLLFPHHECESAQARTVSGQPAFANYWLHTAMVRYQGEKMSKSLGNLIWARDLMREFNADTVRALVHSHPYDETWDYNAAEVPEAVRTADQLLQAVQLNGGDGAVAETGVFVTRFEAAMDANLNTRAALGVLLELAEDIRLKAAGGANVSTAQNRLRRLAGILGFTLGGGIEPRVLQGWNNQLERFK
ncbi:MAG: cysteine--tRNA ligase [Anaerolineae bacterium]